MYSVKKQYEGVQLVSARRTVVLTGALSQQKLKSLAENSSTAKYIQYTPVKEIESKKQPKKDEEVKESAGSAGADQKGV